MAPSSSPLDASTDRLRLTRFFFCGEFMESYVLLVTTMTTFWAKFWAPLLCMRISLIYFFFTVTLKRWFCSWSQVPSSTMNLLTYSSSCSFCTS